MPTEATRLELLLDELVEMMESFKIQVPPIEIPPTDLAPIAAAIQATKPLATPEEIARALAKVIRFPEPQDLTPMLERVAKALEGLEKQRPAASPVGFGNTKVEVRSSDSSPVHVELTNPEDIASGGAAAQPATGAYTNVPASLTAVTVLASNTDRKQAAVFNDAASGNLYLKLGSAAAVTSFTVKIAAGGYYELPQSVYTGVITGVWDGLGGTARVTELVL